MTGVVSSFLNKVTMHRLMVYYLLSLLTIAALLSTLGQLPYNFDDLLISTSILVTSCLVANKLFAGIFKMTTNRESSLITALILSLIMGFSSSSQSILFLIIIGTIAMASKYLVVIKKRHIFNPAALAAFVAAIVFRQGASWWVGNIIMLPFVFVGGLLIISKLKRFKMVTSFLLIYILLLSVTNIFKNISVSYAILSILSHSPILFFSFVMLVEPLTSPFENSKQIVYAIFVAVAFVVYQTVLKNVSYPLELALLTGNLYAFVGNQSSTSFSSSKKQRVSHY